MSYPKRILSALFALVLAAGFVRGAAADMTYRSVEIGGMQYLIEDPARFYAPGKIAHQANDAA